MTYEYKDFSGSLFKNDRREKETHPHATGTALIDGIEYWISAWHKEGKNGKWLSLAFKKKDKQESRKPDNQPSRQTDAWGAAGGEVSSS